MLILAIDTALSACSAAVLDTRSARIFAQESLPMVRGHAEALMPLIARVMAAGGIAFASLDRIAVTTGPGSFTGLRVGLSAARGIALAAARPAVGLTTLTAYAAPFITEDGAHPVIAVVDARHDQVYLMIVSGVGAGLVSPRLASLAEAFDMIRDVCGGVAPRLVGNGATMLRQRWPSDIAPPIETDDRAAPDIGWLAWLGAAVDPDTSPARPTYMRAPDAKPQASPAARAAPPAPP